MTQRNTKLSKLSSYQAGVMLNFCSSIFTTLVSNGSEIGIVDLLAINVKAVTISRGTCCNPLIIGYSEIFKKISEIFICIDSTVLII